MDEQTEFYYTIYPHVVNTLKAEGIDSRWADIVASQMMQESDWGRSSSAKENNFFGMKAGKNQPGTVYNTREGYGRNQKRINDKFLSFPSMEEGIRQGVIRLRDKFGAFKGTPSEEQFIKNINSTPGQIYFTEDPALYLHNLKTINRGKRANTARGRYRQDLAPHYVTPIPVYKETLMDRMKKTAYPIKEFFSKGGHLVSPWDNLSIREKAEMMKVAVRNGITNLPDIKQKYNEFAEGGEIESPVENSNIYAGGSYLDIAKQHIKKNEDWRAKPYRDAPKGKNWRSVGYGFNDSGFRNKYPQGISKHYENGITEAQAEEELNWFLGGVVNHLKKVYGRKWDSFNDNQKAAIIDTYYQRPASVVGKGSRFYRAVMAGDKNAGNYLGVAGYGNRNKDRRKLFGASQIESVAPTQKVLPISEPTQNMPEDTVDFIPWNPQAFFGVNNNTPIIIQQEVPVVEEKMPTPEEIERQERQQGLANFQTIMGMLNNTSNSTSTTMTPFESTVSMLTQQSPIHYFSDGGSIHIKPSHRGRFTELKERTGHSASWFKENGTPAQKKMAIFALNSRHWKHGLGGNLFDDGGIKAGIPVDYLDPSEVMPLVANNPNKSIVLDEAVVTPNLNARQSPIVEVSDVLKVKRPIIEPFNLTDLSETGAVDRAIRVYDNYSEAKDNPLTPWQEVFYNGLRSLKDNVWDGTPSGVSNCTLTASQWVDPTNPIKSASSIVSNPEEYGYSRISEDNAGIGNLVIARNPENNSYHTMLLEDFADKDGTFSYKGNTYPIRKGEPLVAYSTGGHDIFSLRRRIPLSVYTANSDGHTDNIFYRYNYPKRILHNK